MKNSEVINQPDYYFLPCGLHLEDFIKGERENPILQVWDESEQGL